MTGFRGRTAVLRRSIAERVLDVPAEASVGQACELSAGSRSAYVSTCDWSRSVTPATRRVAGRDDVGGRRRGGQPEAGEQVGPVGAWDHLGVERRAQRAVPVVTGGRGLSGG